MNPEIDVQREEMEPIDVIRQKSLAQERINDGENGGLSEESNYLLLQE
jgi:hypothetical protein